MSIFLGAFPYLFSAQHPWECQIICKNKPLITQLTTVILRLGSDCHPIYAD